MIELLKLIDYFKYLLITSWPTLCGLFIICILMLNRLYKALGSKQYKDCKNIKNALGLTAQIVLTFVVLIIYGDMFAKTHGDWLNEVFRCLVLDR